MAQGFVKAGADVLISSRSEMELRSTAAELKHSSSSRVEWISADMTDGTQVDQLAAAALERMGRVDILANNAGGNTPPRC